MQTSLTARPAGHRTPDERAFAVALVGQMPSLKAYARRLTSAAADWEDLVQDTMLRCWSARCGFALGSNLAGWTRTIMRNCFLTGRRRARRHVDLPPDAISDMLSVAENQSAAVDLRDARWAVTQLVPEQRQAVELLVEGMSATEAADRLRIKESTFNSRVFRGRRRLHALVEERSTSSLGQAAPLPPPPLAPISHPTRCKRRDWTGVMIGVAKRPGHLPDTLTD